MPLAALCSLSFKLSGLILAPRQEGCEGKETGAEHGQDDCVNERHGCLPLSMTTVHAGDMTRTYLKIADGGRSSISVR